MVRVRWAEPVRSCVPCRLSLLRADVRANENPALTCVHTLFVREHNRKAGQIASANPSWTDEQIFQAARRHVVALLQHITYDEFLPALLGSPLPAYTGYKASVNPSIATEFSTVGFRVGHSMVNGDLKFMDDNGNEVARVSSECLPLEALAVVGRLFNAAFSACM